MFTQCRLCGSKKFTEKFKQKILNKHIVSYFLCDNCGCFQAEDPFWLEDAYKNSINKSDTGYVYRNLSLSRNTLFLFLWIFNKNKKFLDYAGGYGLLTRLMRDYGLDFYWDDKYTKNIFAQGFEYKNQEIEAMTCFECFEHFENPRLEIEKMLNISKNIYFSTFLIDNEKISDFSWWYYGFEHGQHISFYSIKTLKYLAEKYDLNFYTDGISNHFFADKKISNVIYLFIMKFSKFIPRKLFSRLFLKSKTGSDSLYLIKINSIHDKTI